MRKFLALSISILGAMVAISASAASDPDYRPSNNPLEDRSCFAVNRAYEKMHNSGRDSTNIYALMPDGKMALFATIRAIDAFIYYQADGSDWRKHSRIVRTQFDERTHLPIFTGCFETGLERTDGKLAVHYYALWSRLTWKGPIEIWVDRSSGEMIKTLTHFDSHPDDFPFPVAIQTMDYDRDHAIKPTVSNEAAFGAR